MARMFLAQDRFDDAVACLHTSLAIAERLGDDLRKGGAWYALAECYERQGKWSEAVQLFNRVIKIDERYDLPKLQENKERRARLQHKIQESQDHPTMKEMH